MQPRRPDHLAVPDRPVLRAPVRSRARRTSRSAWSSSTTRRSSTASPTRRSTLQPKAYRLPHAQCGQRPLLELPVVRRRPRPQHQLNSDVPRLSARPRLRSTPPRSPPPRPTRSSSRRRSRLQRPPGPDWVLIGSEGGFLPAPAVLDGQQPTTWITDPTRFDVGNVDKFSLLLAPAERADVIVDFSQVRRQDADPLQRRARRLPGPGPVLRLLHRRPGPVPERRRERSCPATARTRGPSCRSRSPAPRRSRDVQPDRRSRRRAFTPQPRRDRRLRVRPAPDHRRAGRLQLRLRHQLRRQQRLQRRRQHHHPVRRLRPRSTSTQRLHLRASTP